MLELPIPNVQRQTFHGFEDVTLSLIDKVIDGIKSSKHHFICMGLSVEAETDDEKIAAMLLERYISIALDFEASYVWWAKKNGGGSLLESISGYQDYNQLTQSGRVRWLESMKTPKGAE